MLALVSTQARRGRSTDDLEHVAPCCLDDADKDKLERLGPLIRVVEIPALRMILGYILYTSGSTGSHRGLLSHRMPLLYRWADGNSTQRRVIIFPTTPRFILTYRCWISMWHFVRAG